MRKPFPLLAALGLFATAVLVPAPPAGAWIETGHKVVALFAWEEMTPATRAAVSATLKAHPRYEKDLLSGGTMDPVPPEATAGMTPEQLARRAFAAAAIWPDLVRAQGHPMHVQFNHPHWHYIDMPLDEGNQPLPPEHDQGKGPHNVVEALNACTAELRTPATAAGQKAVDVCWIAHLVGDIHQPLHCCSLVSPQFPTGDAGGNGDVVLRDARYANTKENLHLVWDSLPGTFASDDLDRYEALGLHADPRYARSAYGERLADPDPMAWAKESHALAVADVYLDGHLKAATGEQGGRTTGPIPGLPPGYLETAEHVAMRQVSLAGYRLADLLNQTFDPKAMSATR